MKEYIDWYETAKIYDRAEMYEEAAACYDRAIGLKPLHDTAWVHKGFALFMLGSRE